MDSAELTQYVADLEPAKAIWINNSARPAASGETFPVIDPATASTITEVSSGTAADASAALDASPHQLIAIMLSTARERIRLALACLERGDVPRKAHAIIDACAIIGGLNSSLNLEAGGEIADGLSALYDYCQRRLLEANLNNDATPDIQIDGGLSAVLAMMTLAACETVQGAGRDISTAGAVVQQESAEAQAGM